MSMRESLALHGMHVDESWVETIVAAYAQERGNLRRGDLEAELYVQYLHCDLRSAGKSSGKLPMDLSGWRDGTLSGNFALQIEALGALGDETAAKDSRTLKVLLTDGRTDVAGFELSRIADLETSTPVGAKIFVSNARVRHGVLLLDSTCAKFLGGHVPAKCTDSPHNDNQTRASEGVPSQQQRLSKQPSPPQPSEAHASKRIRIVYDEAEVSNPISQSNVCTFLRDFKVHPPPAMARVLAFVKEVKKYYWSSKQQRYILMVTLRDTTQDIDAVFTEEHLAQLFGASSANIRALDQAQQAAYQSRVQKKLENYQGIMKLQKIAPIATSTPSNGKLDAMPRLCSCEIPLEKDICDTRQQYATVELDPPGMCTGATN